MDQSIRLLCVAKNCHWSRKIMPPSNLTRASLLLELRNLQILKSLFAIRAALWTEKLGRCLENCRSWKNTLGKLVVAVNLQAIWFEFWMQGALVTVESFVLCGWWLSNQFDIMSETHFSCDTVGHELWLAIVLSSLLCAYTDWSIRIERQGYVFILTDFKKWCFDVSFLTSISVSTVVLTLGKVEFFK